MARCVHERSGKRMFKVLSAPHCMEFNDVHMVDTDWSVSPPKPAAGREETTSPLLRLPLHVVTPVPAFICWVMCDGGRIPAHQPHRNQPGLYKMMRVDVYVCTEGRINISVMFQ